MGAKSAIKGLSGLICLLLIPALSAAVERTWQTLETRQALVRYADMEALEKFEKKLDYDPGKSGLKWIFTNKSTGDTAASVIRKVDAIYARVQEILEMHAKGPQKVKINVYADEAQLHKAYSRIYHKKTRMRAWYIYEYNTVYLNVRDLHEGMLAHELAHSIIDYYFATRPPRATAEILARYVDEHLQY